MPRQLWRDIMEALAVIGHDPVILKGTQKPPVGQLYCGEPLDNGLIPILFRREKKRSKGDPAIIDLVIAYKKMVVQTNGVTVPLFAYTTTPPAIKELNPYALYPVLVFNITPGKLSSIRSLPAWKSAPFMNDNNMQYRAGVEMQGKPIVAYHWLVTNTNFIPQELPNGGTDDGNFSLGTPIAGAGIIKKFDEIIAAGTRPLEYQTEIILPAIPKES